MPLTAHSAPDLSGQPQAPADGITCRRVETLAEYQQCVALEEAILDLYLQAVGESA